MKTITVAAAHFMAPASAIYFRVAYDGSKNFKDSIERVLNLLRHVSGGPCKDFCLTFVPVTGILQEMPSLLGVPQLGTLPTSRRELRIRADSDNLRCRH